MSLTKSLVGRITGLTERIKAHSGILTSFSVKVESRDSVEVKSKEIEKFTIRGNHPLLIPPNKVSLFYQISSGGVNWVDYYLILDKKGNPFYTAHSD